MAADADSLGIDQALERRLLGLQLRQRIEDERNIRRPALPVAKRNRLARIGRQRPRIAMRRLNHDIAVAAPMLHQRVVVVLAPARSVRPDNHRKRPLPSSDNECAAAAPSFAWHRQAPAARCFRCCAAPNPPYKPNQPHPPRASKRVGAPRAKQTRKPKNQRTTEDGFIIGHLVEFEHQWRSPILHRRSTYACKRRPANSACLRR